MMEERVLEILRQVLDVSGIDAACSQENCAQWDSLHQLSLIVELEDAFNVSFEPEEIASMRSVADIVTVLRAKQ